MYPLKFELFKMPCLFCRLRDESKVLIDVNARWQKQNLNFYCSKVPSANEGYRPSGSRYRSKVWKHFRIDYEDNTKVTCDHCQAKLTYIGGTSTMLKHLQMIHDIAILSKRKRNKETNMRYERLKSGHVNE